MTPTLSVDAVHVRSRLVAVTFVDIRFIQSAAVPIYLLNIGLLLALKVVGTKAKGAESWLVLGPLRVQPAEFMKIGMVLMMAKYFHDDYRPASPSYGFLRLIPPLVLAIVPTLLVLVQPDLGTALMMTFTAVTLIAFARVKWTVVPAEWIRPFGVTKSWLPLRSSMRRMPTPSRRSMIRPSSVRSWKSLGSKGVPSNSSISWPICGRGSSASSRKAPGARTLAGPST